MIFFKKKNKKIEKKPFKEVEQGGGKWFKPKGKLAVDVYETESEIIIQSAIAGINSKDIDISIENDMLLIKGNRDRPNQVDKKQYFYQECWWGPFSRAIILPKEVDPNHVKADMKNGILTIKLIKTEKEKKRKIEIE